MALARSNIQLSLLLEQVRGGIDRRALLPTAVRAYLSDHLRGGRQLNERDLSLGFGLVWLLEALERKFSLNSMRGFFHHAARSEIKFDHEGVCDE
jgi:hypothetical protein